MTLRREAIQKTIAILEDSFPDIGYTYTLPEVAEKIVDSLSSLRGFSTLKTDEEESANPVLSPEDIDFVNKKVDMMIALNKNARWKGREYFRDNHLPYADWYHETTNQICNKRNQRSWQKAFSVWQDEELSTIHLQKSYSHEIAWRKIIADPNELTKTAVAIKASLSSGQPSAPVETDSNDAPRSY